jgi:hypothetical protein
VLPSQRIAQLLWAFSQFGCTPPAPVLSSVMESATAALVTYPPDSMSQLLGALRAFGCALARGPLLAAAAERAAAAAANFTPQGLVDLLEVFADCRFHPGTEFLHAAALSLSRVLAAADASGGPPPLAVRGAAGAARAYAALAYAPPTSLLHQLQTLLAAGLRELEPADLTALLWAFMLFRALSPALWNPACEVLAGGLAEGLPAPALAQLYQVGWGGARVGHMGRGPSGAPRCLWRRVVPAAAWTAPLRDAPL